MSTRKDWSQLLQKLALPGLRAYTHEWKPVLTRARGVLRRRPPPPTPEQLFDFDAHLRIAPQVAGKFVYLPWVSGHSDALVRLLDPTSDFITQLPLFRATDLRARGFINRFVVEHPEHYRRILVRSLAPLRHEVRGMLFTLDWTPPQRQAVYACRELGIPTVLVPHEGVFAERDRYYVDRLTSADVPVCDRTLCWSEQQADVFRERGYPALQLKVVGSPKLDQAASYRPVLTREIFARLYGLTPDAPIVLFAMQPLDAQRDPEEARRAQNDAISDVLGFCETHGVQLIVRLPPSGHDLLAPVLRARLTASRCCALDEGKPHWSEPSEAIWHARVVVSINSTMLLEAVLMRRAALSARYLSFRGLWETAGIASARNRSELERALADAMADRQDAAEAALARVRHALSIQALDGHSVARIRAELDARAELHGDRLAPLFEDRFRPVPCTAGYYREPAQTMAHVATMLGFRHMFHAPESAHAQVCDVFVKWGITPTPQKDASDRWARLLNRPQLVIEDGFLRSRDLGLAGGAGLSIIVDTKTAYYDATRASRLEDRLNSSVVLRADQRERARACMASIRAGRLSKYNHAPDTRAAYGAKPSVLLVDQRRGDQSIESGLVPGDAFVRMLADALRDFPEHDVLVKLHPDATRGGLGSCFDAQVLEAHRHHPRLKVISEEVNPHTLFDQVEQVFVATSGMGFEALIAGLPVRCYGVPFYAGWGLTDDRVPLPRRQRTRDLDEVFHFAYIESSRYVVPERGVPGEIEDVIAYLSRDAPSVAPPPLR